MEAVHQIRKWQETNLGRITFFIVQVGASYGFALLSINNGNLLCYLITIVLFVWGIKNLLKLVGSLVYGRKQH